MWQQVAPFGMATNPAFVPIETPKGWMVSCPANMSADGKRSRKFFKDSKDAEKFAAGLRAKFRTGQRGGLISYDLSVKTAEANRILEPFGLDVLEAAKQTAALRKVLDPHQVSLAEAVKEVVLRLESAEGTELFIDRYKRAILANEEHWSDRYMMDMERLPRWVPEWFMKSRCQAVTPDMMERAVREGGAAARSTIDGRASYLSAIIGYRERHKKTSEITIMNPRQCGQMLRACESKAEVWAVALLIFAGIRPDAEKGEISRLDWSAVGKSEIYISKEVSKTNSDRFIKITPRLRRLLRGEHPAEGPVIPANWKRVYSRLRKAVDGIHGKQDVMRHTFGSNYLVAFGEKKAKIAMGHTPDSQTLYRHYRRAVTEEAGKRFFR